MHTRKRSIPIAGLLAGTTLTTAYADVVVDGSMKPGTQQTLSGSNIEITEEMGQLSGTNLFHSFSEFNLNNTQTANFSGTSPIQNVVGRITGGSPSSIDGQITMGGSAIDANLYLMNPAGIMFGENAQIDINGSFHATTADYLKFQGGKEFHADINKPVDLSVAPVEAFGFLSNAPNPIEVHGSDISAGDTLALISGDLSFFSGDESGKAASIKSPDGNIVLASVRSNGEATITQGQIDTAGFTNMGDINITQGTSVDASGNNGGKIVVRGGNLTLVNSAIVTDTTLTTEESEDSRVDIQTVESVTLMDHSTIESSLKMFAFGQSGNVNIATGNLSIEDGSTVKSEAESLSFGGSGSMNIVAENIELHDRGVISTGSSGSGDSGAITIRAKEDIDIANRSYISSSADRIFGEGVSGEISITARDITINGVVESADYTLEDFTGINAGGLRFTNANRSGDILINTRNLSVNNNGIIQTIALGSHDSGAITVNSDNIYIQSGGAIESIAVSTGKSGGIVINNKNKVLVTGISPNSYNDEYLKSRIIKSGGIETNLEIMSSELTINDGGLISSESSLSTTGSGDLVINTESLKLSGYNLKLFNSHIENGLDQYDALARSRSQVKSYFFRTAVEENTYTAGSISIISDESIIDNHAALLSESVVTDQSSGSAGNISIKSNRLLLNNATISANAVQANGGNIDINGDNIGISNSKISSSIETDIGNGGNIEIASDLLILDKNEFKATAYQGNGGNIHIDAQRLLMSATNSFNVTSQFAANGEIEVYAEVLLNDYMNEVDFNKIDTTKLFKQDCYLNPNNVFSSFTFERFAFENTLFQQSQYYKLIEEPHKPTNQSATNYRNTSKVILKCSI